MIAEVHPAKNLCGLEMQFGKPSKISYFDDFQDFISGQFLSVILALMSLSGRARLLPLVTLIVWWQ